ncbi:glycosyltransferase family 1 protein [Pedobacter yulinensis]|uniref:Glycosyltransferase family 1 protein n=1 Tax=Pedobacter yulinensis TaxID=2126353 RepID=A0A2T3HR05_9SPHI|nr:glycosyltransferase family 1 protein [Pedobacter yulinensis]PST84878.1 glycosyltransferase family 1 protein [Pedobacter yulinensis]
MLEVLFDHQIFAEQRYGGISRYFKHLMGGIQRTDDASYKLGVARSDNFYIQDEPQLLQSRIFDPLFGSQARLLKRNKSYVKYLLRQNRFSVFHPTYYDPYFLKYLKKPFVLTVHDMTYEALPHLFPSSDPTPYHKRLVMEKADKIIAISGYTKSDILKYSDVPEHKIEVVYHGIDSSSLQYASVNQLPGKYILFVGGRWSYKNFYLLAHAFSELSKTDPELHLVLAGGGPLSFGETEFLRRHHILAKTLHLNATDPQLNTLYKRAICFVYPSKYEGFGLPILEAYKNNCPVLLNNHSCFQEIGAGAALYFDDELPHSLENELQRMVNDDALRNSLRLAGTQRLTAFPIERCISKTLDIYRTLT